MQVKVETLYPLEDMWKNVRRMARKTVNKEDLNSNVSDDFKNKMLLSEHSPIRELQFIIEFSGIPTFVAQQFSRHRIATDSGDFLHENINPTDVEHYVQTQRSDRTGNKRGSQENPVNYILRTNAQGLIDMSKKRLCKLASKEAYELWEQVKDQITIIDHKIGFVMEPSCVYRGICPEGKNCIKFNQIRKIKYGKRI